jgi:hypothetical protein
MLTKLCGIVGVVLCLTLGLRVGNVFAETVPSAAERPSQIFAFNDLGMHCYDSDYSVFTILPPFNNLHAQVLRRGRSQDPDNKVRVSTVPGRMRRDLSTQRVERSMGCPKRTSGTMSLRSSG